VLRITRCGLWKACLGFLVWMCNDVICSCGSIVIHVPWFARCQGMLEMCSSWRVGETCIRAVQYSMKQVALDASRGRVIKQANHHILDSCAGY